MATKTETKRSNVLPGFGLTLGFTLAYLGIVVLIPISTIFFKTFTLTWPQFWAAVASPRTIAAYKLSFGASIAGALINSVFGFIVAWSLVRYEFPGKTLIDVMVDLPFALPTSVAGITLTAIYAGNGWIGRYLAPLGIKVAYAPLGVIVALTFVGLPFVVRTIQPVLEDLDQEYEEAAATLGASRLQTFMLVIAPALIPALLTGFALAFARALGEYGSVVFISGNMPMHTEVVPLLIMSKLEQFDYAGATAIAVVMLVASFVHSARHQRAAKVEQPPPGGLTFAMADQSQGAPKKPGTADPPAVRIALIAIALVFVALFIFIPVIAVFTEALQQGIGAYFAAIVDPEARAAIRLTLMTAAIAVPLNVTFGIAASWAIARFDFPGKQTLLTLIDIPFSVSPVIAGMLFVLLLGRARAARRMARGSRHQDYLRGAGNRARDDLRHVPARRARADPDHAGGRQRRRGSRDRAGRRRLANVFSGDAAQRQVGPAVRDGAVQRARDGRVRRGLGGFGAYPRAYQHDAAVRRDSVQ